MANTMKPYGNAPVVVNGDRMKRTTDGTTGYVCPNTRDLHQPESSYQVKVAILMGNKRVNTFLKVRMGWNEYSQKYWAFTRESVQEFISLIPEGMMITAFESKSNSETEKGEYSQSGSPCSESYIDTIAMALYFKSRQLYITVG